MDDFEREALRRLPLAEACYRTWTFVCQAAFLQDLFARWRGRSYEKAISFPVIVQLISDALLQHHGSGRASFEEGQLAGTLEASVAAAFGKLRRLPIPLSVAFLTEGTKRLTELFPEQVAAVDVPASLAEFEVIILDGKAIKKVAKRLKALRGAPGGVLGGRALVAYRVRTGMVVGMRAHADGLVNDVRFVPELLPAIREAVSGPRIHLGDRQFCNLEHLPHYTKDGDHFLLRYHKNVCFTPDPTRPARIGVDRHGRTYREEWGVLGGEQNRLRRVVRRITLERPGSEDVAVVTDLDAEVDTGRFPAVDLLELYLARWNIERAFQQVTEVFNLQRLIGSSPEASIFQFAFCLLMYNILQVIRAYVAVDADKKVGEVSTEKLFIDVQKQIAGCHEVLGAPTIIRLLDDLSTTNAAATRDRLKALLSKVWRPRWQKSKPQVRRHPVHQGKRAHTSAYRLLKENRIAKRNAKPKARHGSRDT